MLENYDKYETNQHLVGMRELFQGYVVKVWTGANFNQNKYNTLNKIVIKHCIIYYMKCWYDRNKFYYNEEFQKKRVLDWKKEIEKQVEINENINVRKFVRSITSDEE